MPSLPVCLLDYLTAKYQDPITDDLLDMASLVDPRFKTQYTDGDKIEEIQAKVMSEMECLLTKQYPAASDQQPTSIPRALMQNKHHPRKQRKHFGFLQTSGAVSASAAPRSVPHL